MDFTLTNQDSALYPLLHFVMDDLPTSTKGPELDDSNTQKVTGGLDSGDMGDLMGIYIAYLVEVGFLDAPPAAQANGSNGIKADAGSMNTEEWFAAADHERKALPKVELSPEMKKLVARNRD